MTLSAMLLLLVVVLCYTAQSFFNKLYSVTYTGAPAAATPVFASLSGLFCAAATFVYNGCACRPSTATLLMGIGNGVVLFLYNLAAINAARSGPYSFQSLLSTMGNILLPLVFAMLLWGEKVDYLHLGGIAVMLAAFVVFNAKGLRASGAGKGFFRWVLLLAASNGVYGILLDCQQRLMGNTQRNEMIIITFLTSALISLIYLAVSQKGRLAAAYRMRPRAWLAVALSSAAAATAVNLLMRALRTIPVAVLYTLNNGGVLVLSVLLGTLVFGERFGKEKACGLLLATVAFVLLGQP